MSKPKESSAAQPTAVNRAEADRSRARHKDKKQAASSRDEDLPGAEGPLSAGANEDTYD